MHNWMMSNQLIKVNIQNLKMNEMNMRLNKVMLNKAMLDETMLSGMMVNQMKFNFVQFVILKRLKRDPPLKLAKQAPVISVKNWINHHNRSSRNFR